MRAELINWLMYSLRLKWELRTYQWRGSDGILGNEIPGMGETPKEETYNVYGDSARKIEIWAVGKRGTFFRTPYADIHDGESLIVGRFGYAVGNKPLSADYAKTAAYVGEYRKLDA